jgi:hypothetical protein
VTAAKGGSGADTSDNAIYVPLTTGQRLLAVNPSIYRLLRQAIDQESMTSYRPTSPICCSYNTE